MTYASDQNTIADTKALGGATNALTEFAAAATDASSKIKDLVDDSLTSFNDQVLKSLTTRDHQNSREFRNLGAGIFRSAAGKGLSAFEGIGLSALGLGGGKKPTGAAGDPLHVVMEPGVGSSLSALSSLFSGSAASAGASAASSTIGGFASLADAVPFLASGGYAPANYPVVVGEEGPELFMPGTGGTVVPNRALNSLGGTTHNHTWNIDARGAHDPAAVGMQIHRAIRAAAPQIAAASIAAQHDMQRRKPSIKR